MVACGYRLYHRFSKRPYVVVVVEDDLCLMNAKVILDFPVLRDGVDVSAWDKKLDGVVLSVDQKKAKLQGTSVVLLICLILELRKPEAPRRQLRPVKHQSNEKPKAGSETKKKPKTKKLIQRPAANRI